MLEGETCISFRADLAGKRSNNDIARAQVSSNSSHLSPLVNDTLGWTHGDIIKPNLDPYHMNLLLPAYP